MEPSKSKSGKRGSGKRKLAVFFAVLVALSVTLGPSLVLNLTLTYLPDLGGPQVKYTHAKAGFLFRSITITDLDTTKNNPWRITAGTVKLQGISFINSIRWLLDPQSRPSTTLSLVQNLNIQDLMVVDSSGKKTKISMSQGTIQNLAWSANESNPKDIPMAFTQVDLTGLEGKVGAIDFNVGQFFLKDLGADLLSLKVSDFNLKNTNKQTELKLQNMAIQEVGTEDVVGMLQGTVTPGPWWVISALPKLDISEGIYTQKGKELLFLTTTRLKSPLIGDTPENLSFTQRSIKFKIGSKQMGDWLQLAPKWNLQDIFGPHLAGELALDWTYKDGSEGIFNLRKASLNLSDFGILELSGELQGVKKPKSHLNSAQLLFSIMKWKFAKLDITYQDQGSTQKIYDLLERTTFTKQGRSKTASKIQTHYLNPWLKELQAKAPLDVLPALKAELSAYLNQPESFQITIKPHAPLLVVTLIDMNITKMIKKMGVTIQVNKRAPLSITAHNTGRLNNKIKIPQPLNDLFTGEKN